MPLYPGPQGNKVMYPAYYCCTPVATPLVVAPVVTAPVVAATSVVPTPVVTAPVVTYPVQQPQVVVQPVQPIVPLVYPVYPAAVVPVATPGCQFFVYNRKRG
ncbi:hypothetical protein PpBr36_00932 [Pyricularia pennisetigena]|uniref:hypothetical protein n=1 Tax=Pyricularia pennisetigena TaxID=1578925 RepID=UPI001153DC3B|nr:hypothetical protein PpBr36_00932 [Pyricularia pennisetigena]TLS28156.1 hypothetical protein PpBr36_00932 [Pyricularia pennisetigena]